MLEAKSSKQMGQRKDNNNLSPAVSLFAYSNGDNGTGAGRNCLVGV